MTADPSFVDATFGPGDPMVIDSPTPGSAAIDGGMPLGDYWTDPVPMIGTGPDRGAFEMGGDLVVHDVIPDRVPLHADARIILKGRGFDPTAQVSLAGAALDDVVVVSSTTIFATVLASETPGLSLIHI